MHTRFLLRTLTRNLSILIFAFSLTVFHAVNAQTTWTKDAANPVLRRDTVVANLPNDLIAISDCWVLKENAVYKMWYTCGGINYPADTALRARICYATSADGVMWSKYAGNPVMDVSYTGSWDSLGIETASVIIDSAAPPSERYKMWYAGHYFNSYRYDIGYAYSADGITWIKHTSPVLSVGNSTEWDNGFLEGPSVIKDGNVYKMWYCGYDAIGDNSGTDGKANIGYATSTDGINWIKDASNPIFTTGTGWDSVYVQDPHVIKSGNVYRMWYGGNSVGSYGQEIGYATSTDGINWTRLPAQVLNVGATGSWDANTASFPSVLYDNGNWMMWYTGKDIDPPPPGSLNYYWELGFAISPVTAITESEVEHAALVYPNPASQQIVIANPWPLTRVEVTISNALGQIVEQIQVADATTEVNVSAYPPGIYQITINGPMVSTARFVVAAQP